MYYFFEFNFNNIDLTKELIYFILKVVVLKLMNISFKVKSIFFKDTDLLGPEIVGQVNSMSAMSRDHIKITTKS